MDEKEPLERRRISILWARRIYDYLRKHNGGLTKNEGEPKKSPMKVLLAVALSSPLLLGCDDYSAKSDRPEVTLDPKLEKQVMEIVDKTLAKYSGSATAHADTNYFDQFDPPQPTAVQKPFTPPPLSSLEPEPPVGKYQLRLVGGWPVTLRHSDWPAVDSHTSLTEQPERLLAGSRSIKKR